MRSSSAQLSLANDELEHKGSVWQYLAERHKDDTYCLCDLSSLVAPGVYLMNSTRRRCAPPPRRLRCRQCLHQILKELSYHNKSYSVTKSYSV